MIPDDVVERVRTAADIVQVIGEYVPLRRVGTDFRGACPFHGGKNPNFSVSAKRGQYHCFVCHESGDVISFLRKRLSLDFTAAVKLLGEKVGVEVIDKPTRAHAPDPNEPNWEVLAHAAAWFHAQLREADVAAEARRYLMGRGLDEAAWSQFTLGFAPRDGQLLLRHLATLGFDQERAREAGLLVVREEDGSVKPRFRGRVMFPITDELGRHVAFGGRALGDDTPKYLNSAESGVFQKRRVLYGMHTARHAARRASRLLVVEGYLDAIRVALAGIEEVVAPLGTALTEEQAALVVRYAPEVFLLYDSDEAGLKATFRSGLELLRHGARVRVVSLPPGEDPDTFVRARGAAGLEGMLHEAVDLFDRQVDLLARKGWFADLHHRRRAVDKLLPTIRATRDAITRDLYIARLAEAASLDRGTVLREAETSPPPPGRTLVRRATADEHDGPLPEESPPVEEAPGAPPARRPWVPKAQWRGRGRPTGPEWLATDAPPRADAAQQPLESEALRLLLSNRQRLPEFVERHPPESFRSETLRRVFEALLRLPEEVETSELFGLVGDAETVIVQELLAKASAPGDLGAVSRRLLSREADAQIAELRARMDGVDESRKAELLQQIHALVSERNRLRALRPDERGQGA